MEPGAKRLPSLEQTTSKLFLLPNSVRFFSAKPRVSASLRVMAECWKPEDLVKKRIFLRGPAGASSARAVRRKGERARPVAAMAEDLRRVRRSNCCMVGGSFTR